MDYTNSSGFAVDVLTGNRMHVTSPVPTEVSEADLNQVNWELMEVIKAAGLTGAAFDKATPATYQKLLSALRSTGVFNTAAEGDNSTRVATTAWVKRAFDFSSSQSQSGYQKLPSGLILQWGVLGLTGTYPYVGTITFPIAFPNQVLAGGATLREQPAGNPPTALYAIQGAATPATSPITLYGTGSFTTVVSWWAFGR